MPAVSYEEMRKMGYSKYKCGKVSKQKSEIEEKITQVEALLTSEGYNTEKIYTKSIANLAE